MDIPEMVRAFTTIWELGWKYGVYGTGFPASQVAASMESGYTIYDVVVAKKLKWAMRAGTSRAALKLPREMPNGE